VQRVTEGTSAEAGGVLAGDRLMTWNGKPIEDVGGWMRLMLPHEAGDVVRVGVDRDGERVELMIKLYPRLLEEQDEE
jgi:S1-C subfamily serine protease